MTARQALALVRKHGVVLEAAAGPVPSLASAIAGEPIRGSWWAHPRGREIFAVTRAVRDSEEVLVCRVVDGKVTYVHRRLWPALVRVAEDLPRRYLARVRELHTTSGRHITREVAYPRWVPAEVARVASKLSKRAAKSRLGAWCSGRGSALHDETQDLTGRTRGRARASSRRPPHGG